MKALVLLLLALVAAAAAETWQITQPAVSGAGATANTYLEAWSPAWAALYAFKARALARGGAAALTLA